MSGTVTTAFWGMTINNYDDTDLALVQNGYPDYLREIVHTLEEGKEGTPHIQAWIKLQRQQRLSFVKKLFPRGHFKALTAAEYTHNTKKYAQKLDSTAVAAAVHKFNDPTGTVEALIPKVVERIQELKEDPEYEECNYAELRGYAEQDLVEENWRLAKIFVSAVYKQMWKQFGDQIWKSVCDARHTHTHTHDDEKFSRGGSITEDATEEGSEGEDAEDFTEGEDGEDYEDGEGEADEGSAESECDGFSDEDAGEGSGEQDALSAY